MNERLSPDATGDHLTMSTSPEATFARNYLHVQHLQFKGLQPKTIDTIHRNMAAWQPDFRSQHT